MSKPNTYNFDGTQITVTWDRRLCIHIGECGQSEGDLFEQGRDPWCIPDQANPQEVAEICRRCPSGALSYQSDSVDQETAAAENFIQVIYKGPLYCSGNLNIDGAPDDMPATRYRAALCRCGASKNKPFCDNSHIDTGFDDYAAIGSKVQSVESPDGVLNITPVKDGPLIINGKVCLKSGSGRIAWCGEKTSLCRCGASKNKPFCDGSHFAAGFTSD